MTFFWQRRSLCTVQVAIGTLNSLRRERLGQKATNINTPVTANSGKWAFEGRPLRVSALDRIERPPC
jgi:hypothetical protein